MRFSDSHETVRAVARHGVQGALAAQVLMLALDGVPLFYNGMEVGDATESADPALFEKLPVYWSPGGRPPLREIYRNLIKLRKANPALHNDSVTWLQNSVPAEVVTLLRKDDKNEFVVFVNLASLTVSGTVELPGVEQFEQVKIEGVPALPRSTLPEFKLSGYEWRIFQRQLAK